MVTCETWSLRIPVGSKYMYKLRFDKETLCFGKLLFMRGGCNQRLQSLLNLSLITVHNAHEKQHCQDIRDNRTCENHCRCDRILSLRCVARIQTGLNSCDVSQGQNKRKQPCRTVCTHLRQVAATKFKSTN